jgi:hypothetical protein
MTLRTCDSSVRAIAAICGALIPVVEASTMIARWRLDWYLAFLEIDFNREPSSGESSRTNTSGGRIATSMDRDVSQFAAHGEFPVKRSWPTH